MYTHYRKTRKETTTMRLQDEKSQREEIERERNENVKQTWAEKTIRDNKGRVDSGKMNEDSLYLTTCLRLTVK